MFWIYILKSLKKEWFYLGSTDDLKRRLIQHNSGHTPSTKKFRPLELVYSEEFSTLKEARKREWFLKSPKGYLEKKGILEKVKSAVVQPQRGPFGVG